MAKKEASQSPSLFVRLFPTFARLVAPKSAAKAEIVAGGSKKVGRAKPKLPIVNLLPPRLELEKAKRSTRRGFMFAAIALLVTTALLWLTQQATLSIAEQSLKAAQSQVDDANNKIAEYQPIKDFFDDIAARQGLIAEKSALAVDYNKVNKAILAAIPDGGSIIQVEIKALPPVDPNAPAQSAGAQCGIVTSPFEQEEVTPLACISFTGSVVDRTQISTVADTLNSDGLFSNISVSQSSGAALAGGNVAFSGTAVITMDALASSQGVSK